MNEKLQQSTAFRPFPWKLIALAEIAMITTQHEITDIIGGNVTTSNTTQRIGMFNVVDILSIALLKLSKATSSIVATVVLSLQLLLDLGPGMSRVDGQFF